MERKDEDILKDMHFENKNENCAVNQGVFYGSVFALPGSNPTINNNYGKLQKKIEKDDAEGVETAEAREKKKAEVMKAITDRFDFEDEQLGYDHRRKKITNDRLAILFRKCFGIGSYPTSENKIIMEQLWVLLIDERNQCPKMDGEQYIRQTVLNIIGYFKSNDIVFGQPRDIARAIFKDADTNIAKNVTRGISSNVFPEGTDDMLDLYIEKLLNGEF